MSKTPKHPNKLVAMYLIVKITGCRDVASERPGGAAPPGILPAPPRKFAQHTF